jgi:hypothetical protein
MLADWQGLVMGRAGNRPIDTGELATGRGFVFPDLGRNVRRFAHLRGLFVGKWKKYLADMRQDTTEPAV